MNTKQVRFYFCKHRLFLFWLSSKVRHLRDFSLRVSSLFGVVQARDSSVDMWAHTSPFSVLEWTINVFSCDLNPTWSESIIWILYTTQHSRCTIWSARDHIELVFCMTGFYFSFYSAHISSAGHTERFLHVTFHSKSPRYTGLHSVNPRIAFWDLFEWEKVLWPGVVLEKMI